MEPYVPPCFIIDLSLPPRDRYRQLARHYKDDVQDLTGLFDDLLRDIAIPEKWIPRVNRLSRFLLRRVYVPSQTEELQGISEESGVPMYLLVALNVILDLLMGCTSGGVRTLEKTFEGRAKMLHFRTLDWTMDPLRRIIVQLDFIRSKSESPQQILASSITYVGFTGVLTGVRPGLSMSLNFRAVHDNSTKSAQFRFYFHHLLVLLGRRPSIATYLRDFLTGTQERTEASLSASRMFPKQRAQINSSCKAPRLVDVYAQIASHHTTAAYLIFSDGDSTISIDKDFRSARLRRSETFIATTNHDVIEHGEYREENAIASRTAQSAVRPAAGLDAFLDESEDRLNCISNRWQRLVTRRQRKRATAGEQVTAAQVEAQTAITKRQVIDWLSNYPTTNECTHFAAVMDPQRGTVAWCMAYPEPLGKEGREQLGA